MRIAITWGIRLGVAVLTWTAVVHLLGIYTTRVQYASRVDQAATILIIGAILGAIAQLRRGDPGAFTVWRGVLVGTAVAAISAPITVAGLWVYHHYVNPGWVTYLVNFERETLAAAGTPADVIAAKVAQLQQGSSDRQQVLGGILGSLGFGLVLSTAISIVVKLSTGRRPAAS